MNSRVVREDIQHTLDQVYTIVTDRRACALSSRKRSCEYNLGGHCETENAASIAAQWHYLNSPWSPGRRRKRRSTPADHRSRKPRVRRCKRDRIFTTTRNNKPLCVDR